MQNLANPDTSVSVTLSKRSLASPLCSLEEPEGCVSKRVLLIDDEATLRRVTQLTLKKLARWDVLVASSGHVGLQQAETEQPDAILLDWMMPEMDGLATLIKLRENSATQHIPVILLTAKVQAMKQPQLQQLNVAAIVVKPFEPEMLVLQIKAALGWS
ncbi:MAG: response regulator [Elainellaceae cyanobacterium]